MNYKELRELVADYNRGEWFKGSLSPLPKEACDIIIRKSNLAKDRLRRFGVDFGDTGDL